MSVRVMVLKIVNPFKSTQMPHYLIDFKPKYDNSEKVELKQTN